MSILEQYVPEGYKMMESGDFFVTEGGQEDITVEKINKDVIMKIRFVLADGTFIAGGDYFLPEGIQNMSILEEYVPEGYKMMESATSLSPRVARRTSRLRRSIRMSS